MAGRVIVIGSVNVDRVIRCATLPAPGETAVARSAERGFGGKGANQAAAAARLGAPTWLIGAVGADADGSDALAELRSHGVQVRHVPALADAATGVAIVLVDDAGDNSIVVIPGANAALEPARVTAALAALGPQRPDVVLACAEIPDECVLAAAAAAGAARVVYNLAPARPLPAGLAPDVLVVNELEARQVSGADDPDAALDVLAARLPAVICTRGAAGAVLRTGAERSDIAGTPVRVIDTTGAGDAFCGALAADLAAGRSLPAAVTTAVAAGGVAVTGPGARGALATRRDLAG